MVSDQKTDVDDGPDTVRLDGLPQMNERDYARYDYEEKKKIMLKEKTQKSIDDFVLANAHLAYVEGAYRQGDLLMHEYLFWKENRKKLAEINRGSQNLHSL